ncbi:MAG TPA: PP0621 family protein [Thermoanaerobaculia bacterium]|nr:PP0621 family protein [Thermoanaerobaculia bacterium]
MTRLLAIALLLVILWLAVDNLAQRFKAMLGSGAPRRSVRPQRPAATQSVETLVPCAACGAYVPSSRALKGAGGEGEVFCSEECRKAFQPLS